MLSVFGDTPRGGAMEARKAHNLEVAGSSPAPATVLRQGYGTVDRPGPRLRNGRPSWATSICNIFIFSGVVNPEIFIMGIPRI